MAAVKIAGLGKDYGSLRALDRIDLEIGEGEFFALLGPNGAGKSTLINILAGLVRASRGRAAVAGFDVRRQWRQARRSLGVVPQELAYDPFFTVRELLTLQAGYFGCGRGAAAWIDELIGHLGLEEKAETLMNHLSGGMKRRVLVAQALVHRPPVVILDEPTAGVDVALRRRLWEFIRGLNRSGHTIILTTHYLEEAESMCRRVAVLNRGRLIALAPLEELLQRYSWRLLHLKLRADSPGSLPPGLAERAVKVSEREIVLRLHREKDPLGGVLAALEANGVRFSDLRIHEPGLTEVYSELTAEQKPC
jgi:ABC-2 type transport system ATP-binding protein